MKGMYCLIRYKIEPSDVNHKSKTNVDAGRETMANVQADSTTIREAASETGLLLECSLSKLAGIMTVKYSAENLHCSAGSDGMDWEDEGDGDKKFKSGGNAGPGATATEENKDAGAFLDSINFKKQSKARLFLFECSRRSGSDHEKRI